MTKIILTSHEEKVLKDSLLRFNVDLITRKARIILFLASGGRVTEAVKAFGISRHTVYKYIKQFRKEGVQGLLKLKPITGRPSRLPGNIKDIIVDALKRCPTAIEQLDTAACNWTLELMRDYLRLIHNIAISLSYMGLLMQKYGMKNIYSRAIMTSPDPQYSEKAEVVKTLKNVESRMLEKGRRVFFEDEMKVGFYPRMFRKWSIPGMRHVVEAVCALEGKKSLFGSVDTSTGELTLLVREHCEQLLLKYPDDTLNVICDNSIIHCLPRYAFYLNAIELLWLYVRKAVCYNNQFRKLQWLVEEVLDFLNKLSPKRILKAIGINLRENFWK